MDKHSGDLTVLQINDTHAYLEPHYEVFAAGGRMEYRVAGGYAAIATLVQQTRDERKGQMVLLDSGDTFHGTYPAVQTRRAGTGTGDERPRSRCDDRTLGVCLRP